MRKAFLLFLTIIFFQNVFAQTPPQTARSVQTTAQSVDLSQYGVKIEPDQRLIVVMATLDAAEPETALTPAGSSFRQTLRQDAQNISPELRQKIKSFIEQFKRRHPSEKVGDITAPFVSLAYTLSPVPELADPARSLELPPEVLEVLDFAPLVREFYKTSGISAKLPGYVKTYQAEGDKMRGSAAAMVSELVGYLHTRPVLTIVERVKTEEPNPKNKKKAEVKTNIRERARRFLIVPELFAPAGTINFRNIGDDYFAVVPPDTNLNATDVRRAYLQFVTDALVFENAKDILPFREGIKQLLDERQKAGANVSADVFLTVSRSLAAAVEAKQIEYKKVNQATADARRKIDAAQSIEAKKAVSAALERDKQAFADETALKLSDAYEQGAVLDFYFAQKLKGLEDSGFDIAGSFRDMILSLDAPKESARLAEFSEARQRALASRGANLNKNLELPKKLLEIDEIIKAKNYAEADARLKNLLEENPNEPRIYYTLGRVASSSAEGTFDENLLSERLGRAAAYYRNAILSANKNTDPALLSLSHVALGRILEFNDQNQAALKEYEAAITLGDMTGGAYKEAIALKDKLSKKQ